MKIGSNANIKSFKINVANIVEQKEDLPEQNQDLKVEAEAAEKQEESVTINARPLNMMARNFVHADGANEDDNYSLVNLNGMKNNQSLMTKYNSTIMGIMNDRMGYVDDLIESGVNPIDAKSAAAAIYEKKGADAHDKLGEDMDGEEIKKQAEETKEYNEKRTEEVVEEKHEEKVAEEKKTEEKAQEKVTEDISEKMTAQSEPTVKSADTGENISSDSGSTEASATGSEKTSAESTENKSTTKASSPGDNVDKFV